MQFLLRACGAGQRGGGNGKGVASLLLLAWTRFLPAFLGQGGHRQRRWRARCRRGTDRAVYEGACVERMPGFSMGEVLSIYCFLLTYV